LFTFKAPSNSDEIVPAKSKVVPVVVVIVLIVVIAGIALFLYKRYQNPRLDAVETTWLKQPKRMDTSVAFLEKWGKHSFLVV